ncbi:transcriptional regulator PhoU [Oleiphilus sp. HI0071]|jgi:phosphate transport system protein|nr:MULTISPECIES: phosphate signaling complex protein PhoU [unclassified Oleiphilus]KZY68022.1 transcriptional regulator PhoU [Oleiphilus sp. HI0065]KZY80447.1 transcriptional regulator PhoU [Oleiphilus sp. HI0071]KZY93076.1 transcriptional regulator PhoU [Oleiphilus sp. HI0073]KZZ51608.1 transcriptional regulator PhoU [Oleiphilus sp. HI0122]KZZ54780.1 transcriptional regulator PhoU [Oleiphilus sp. HI0118]KZZ74269.1 transcriptional regulator PhoU [Oleiphilus sp. HI0130]KZZ76648.1 transcriptio
MSSPTHESHNQHISQQFNQNLSELRSHFLEMGGLVQRQITDAVESLLESDTALAESVRDTEKNVDDMERMIDEECTQIIARRQPAASDLRLVISTVKMVADLERIGDEAAKIAKMAVQISDQGKLPRGYVEVRHISKHVVQMVNGALDAFARFDANMALDIIREDRAVDEEYGSAIRSLMTFMMEDPRSISQVHNVLWVLRALERIGDHAANVAEYVIYLVKGEDIRHMKIAEAEQLIEGN